MIDYDERPGHPPDRTVCGDRRPRCSTSSGAGAPTAADRRRTGVSGRGPGAAWVRLRAPLDPLCLLPAGPPVPLLAQPARLPQAAAGRRATAGPGDQPPGPGQPVVVRQPAADRRHAAAVWSLAGDGQPLGHRRNRRIRVLCLPHPLLLGPQALSGHRARRDARHLVLGGPEAPASGRSAWTC
jgi:hypothetical protein